MARKTSLREFQQNVAQRIRDLASQKTVASKLGFQVGTENWLVTLSDVSEVIPAPRTINVPRTLPWFRGVANIRGKLYSVVDFAAFQGEDLIGPGMEKRVILISDRLIEGSGLMVSRMLGLRNPEQFTVEPAPQDSNPRAWVKAQYRDPAGALWRELDVAALVANLQFLEVGSSSGDSTASPVTAADGVSSR
ncbi:MAG: chemotaxis protein CheW [Betaproteobacteria bacterium]